MEASKAEPADLGVRVARKALLAVAGLVSVHNHIWTTDRNSSAQRWAELHPQQSPQIEKLMSWSDSVATASRDDIIEALAPGGVVGAIVDEFEAKIGLWKQMALGP